MAMKLIMEGWRQYINEIGDAGAKSYPFERAQGERQYRPYLGRWPSVKYGFHSEKYSYLVNFDSFYKAKGVPSWDISFEIDEDEGIEGSDDSYEMSGEGRPLRIISTIVNIIKDFIKSPELNKGTLSFHFTGVPKRGEEQMDYSQETQRTRLYKIFLEKNMPPGTEITELGNNKIEFTVPGGDK